MADKDNIQYAEQQVAALNAHDIEGYVSRIDDSYVGFSELAQGQIRGREGVRQYIETILRAFPDVRVEVEQIIASGDYVVTRSRVIGTHKGTLAGIAPTNKSVVVPSCNVVELRNGKAIQGRIYSDNASLFQQLGVFSLPKATSAS